MHSARLFGEPMPHVGKVSSRLFALPEFERAQFDLFHSAVRHLMKAKNSLLCTDPGGHHSETIPATQNTMPSGETVTSEPIMMKSKIVFQWDDIRNCNRTLWPNKLTTLPRSGSPSSCLDSSRWWGRRRKRRAPRQTWRAPL